MPATRPADHTITRAAQLRAIASPVRQQLISLMEELDTFSVGDLAARTGRPAESTYYHVHQLVKAGLVEEAGLRPGVRRPETLYRLIAGRLHVDLFDRRPAYRAAMKKSARAVCRLAEGQLQEAFDDPHCHLAGPHANFRLHQRSARLPRAKVKELARMLAAIDDFLRDHNDPDAEPSYLVTTSYVPQLR